MNRARNISISLKLIVLITILIGIPASGNAQVQPADSIASLKDQLEKKQAAAERMNRMLEALNQVDSLYKVRYPTWIVIDDDMGERIRRSFRVRKIEYPPSAQVQVVANPQAGEILEISIGTARMGRNDARVFLSDSLYKEILAGNYVRQVIDARPNERRIGQLYGVHPRFAAAYGSAFGAGIMISNGWGAEAKMGFEEIGYHFWSTGSMRGLAVFDQFKLGAVIPIVPGTSDPVSQPLDIRSRRMTGAIGFSSELTIPWEDQAITAILSVADLSRLTNPRLLTDTLSIYFLHTVAQATYSRQLRIGTGHYLTLTGGLGYHQVANGLVQPNNIIVTADKEDFLSPVVRVEYMNRVSNMFGATAQLYSSIVYLKGWVEIVRNLLYVELQYYSPLFRDPRPWEQPYFFMISPRIQVIY